MSDVDDLLADLIWAEQEGDGCLLIIRNKRSVHWNFKASDSMLGLYSTDTPVNFGTVWKREGLSVGEPLQLVLRDWLLEEKPLLDVCGLVHDMLGPL